jgi:hypothetical protein
MEAADNVDDGEAEDEADEKPAVVALKNGEQPAAALYHRHSRHRDNKREGRIVYLNKRLWRGRYCLKGIITLSPSLIQSRSK